MPSKCPVCQRHDPRLALPDSISCIACCQILNSVKSLAHQAVAKARRDGILRPPKELPCADCGKPAFAYDHRAYSRPLAVVATCRSCNWGRGSARDLFRLGRAIHQRNERMRRRGMTPGKRGAI